MHPAGNGTQRHRPGRSGKSDINMHSTESANICQISWLLAEQFQMSKREEITGHCVFFFKKIYSRYVRKRGTLLVSQLVEALHYKPKGRGFDSRWCHWNISWEVKAAGA